MSHQQNSDKIWSHITYLCDTGMRVGVGVGGG